MKIACVGWGSLIWDSSREFIIDGDWNPNGPKLPIEFARQSTSGSITLVIENNAKPVKTLWAYMLDNEISFAIGRLRTRERTATRFIHSLAKDSTPKNLVQKTIQDWMKPLQLDAVIWTGLPPKFNGVDNIIPSINELKKYFRVLQKKDANQFAKAREYVLKAPEQVQTNYRPELEELLR